MRQKKMIIAALATMLLAIPAMVQSKKGEAAKVQTLEVSFDYQRQAGHTTGWRYADLRLGLH